MTSGKFYKLSYSTRVHLFFVTDVVHTQDTTYLFIHLNKIHSSGRCPFTRVHQKVHKCQKAIIYTHKNRNTTKINNIKKEKVKLKMNKKKKNQLENKCFLNYFKII